MGVSTSPRKFRTARARVITVAFSSLSIAAGLRGVMCVGSEIRTRYSPALWQSLSYSPPPFRSGPRGEMVQRETGRGRPLGSIRMIMMSNSTAGD